MVEMLYGNKKIEIDTDKMIDEIDDVFHRHITRKTSITINHNRIQRFV